MAFDLDDSNDNLVEFDDVVVRYDRGLADAEPDAVQKAQARARLRADTEVNGNDIKSVAARAVDLESRADTARGERENQADALRNVEATAGTQGDTLDSLSRDQLELSNRVADTERDAEANSRAIEETRSQTVINREEIRSTAGRLTDYQASVGAINLITPPGKTVSPATKDVANARATESVKAEVTEQGNMLKSVAENAVAISGEVESLDSAQRATATALDSTNLDVQRQGDTLTNHGERLQTLDTEYADQQGQIATKASQARVDEVESSAQGARSSLATDLRAEFNSALDGQDFSNYATLNELAKVEADAESARSQLQTTLSSQVGDNTAAIQNTAETVDGISAQQVFKTEANGVVAGLGLASGPSGPDGVTQSRIYFAADTIAFVTDRTVTPTSETLVTPFVVEDTPNGTGQVVINSALIGRAQITDAMIESLGANKITADSLSAISANMGTLTTGLLKTRNNFEGRVEIGSVDSFPLWAGRGSKTAGNANMYIDSNGQVVMRQANVIDTLQLRGQSVTISDSLFDSREESFGNFDWEFFNGWQMNDNLVERVLLIVSGSGRLTNGSGGGKVEIRLRVRRNLGSFSDVESVVLTKTDGSSDQRSASVPINVPFTVNNLDPNSNYYFLVEVRVSGTLETFYKSLSFTGLKK